jgi:transposase
MGTVPVYVGLDYHSRSVQVCVVDGDGRVLVNRRCGNSLAAVAGAVGPGWSVAGAAVESCCGAADLAECLRERACWPVTLAHPGYVRRMKHNPDKSDYSDARMLAELSRAGFVPAVWLAPSWVRDLRMLVRLRADLVGRIRAIKTRILGVLRAQRVSEPACPGRWTLGWLSWLDGQAELNEAGRFVVRTHLAEWRALVAQVKEVESRLGALTAGDRVVARLLEHRGVGKVTAWTMRAMIGDFGRFTSGKQLARFCAVTPRNASSGERVADAGLIKAGDPLLKSVLIEAAHRLRRREPRWSAFSAGLSARGKPVSVIVAAIANRWVRWLYHQMKEEDRPAATAA